MDLVNYDTGKVIRKATAEEIARSERAAKLDGGRGVIQVKINGKLVDCYVEP